MQLESNPNFILIPSASHKIYGYMNNDSKHSFTEKEGTTYIRWPTVTHYVEAKKFEGTQYEHTIRKAKTVTQVRILSRERDVRVTTRDVSNFDSVDKRKVYGNKNTLLHIKPSWESEREHHLRVAITAKFKQNSSIYNALLSTAPLIIEGEGASTDVLTANILMEIRENASDR